MSKTPWKIEYEVQDTAGASVEFLDGLGPATELAKEVGGAVIEIRRYTDDRHPIFRTAAFIAAERARRGE